MSRTLTDPLHPSERFVVDLSRLRFSLLTYVAASIVLIISFTSSLPRPWWALLTLYVTAQSMTGPSAPRVLYRILGIVIGAFVTLALVPNMQNSPVLLVLCLSIWTGLCIYLAVLDRTPRAVLFQMSAFSAAVISFPYLDDPTNIFTTTISRVLEMIVAILCIAFVHGATRPMNVHAVISKRSCSFLVHAARWTADALGTRHTTLEYEHRRMLASDVTELGMLAVTLGRTDRQAFTTRDNVIELQHHLAELLPLATAAANRLDTLRALQAVDSTTNALVARVIDYLRTPPDVANAMDIGLSAHCRELATQHALSKQWTSLLMASFCDRIAEFIDTLHAARALVRDIGDNRTGDTDDSQRRQPRIFPLSSDGSIALLAGIATMTAVLIYCGVWILLAWPSGSTTAAFAALITCSFAAQDDPAPAIRRYLVATLSTFPLAALYLFVLLPRVDGTPMLILTLAPALIWMGYLQADPASAARALPMLSCFIVALGFLDRFHVDFAAFANTALAQLTGIVTTLVVTTLFRSASLRWRAYRIVHRNWSDLARLADPHESPDTGFWTAHATDRLGQLAARMALVSAEDALHEADGLMDLRIGRNIIRIRQGLERGPESAREALREALSRISALYRERIGESKPVAGSVELLNALDRAIGVSLDQEGPGENTLLALVGLRCNLFPHAPPFDMEGR
ncbi:FUSC family protein [Paraburkholderia sp. C35]|uniref:FUSC family protein n=1 Tax=Paraburkholderia sp. C35 TaxID=2126993 RepID=UPI000D69BB16|nr:FUSC family protein [Paraburkholderia sp. C35]